MSVRFAWREAWRYIGRRRAQFLWAISTTGISLFLFGLFVVVTVNAARFLQVAQERVEVFVFLADDAPVEELQARVRNLTGVAGVHYVSQAQALADFRRELGEDARLIDALARNPLPASLRITSDLRHKGPAALAELERKLLLLPGVREVWYGKEVLGRLTRLLTLLAVADVVMLLIIGAACVFVVFQSIQMIFLARAREVEIMRLVGATPGTIRTPYLIEGLFEGVGAGLLAFVLLTGAALVARWQLPFIVYPVLPVGGLLVLIGALLGTLGANLAAGRYLR